ncbi:phosphohistidine phosphatase SixA [Planctomycetota bacterium]
MNVYLVQHGEAKPKTEDPERPLTDRGREDTTRIGRFVAPLLGGEVAIRHSGKLRAKQTAAILAQNLKVTREPEAATGLAPNDDPAAARSMLEQMDEPVVLVGHLPHLSRLASLVLSGDASREPVSFRPGGMVCLAREDTTWRLLWALTPELLH